MAEDRLDRLERRLAELESEVAALRGVHRPTPEAAAPVQRAIPAVPLAATASATASAAPRPLPPAAPPPPPPAQPPAPSFSFAELEEQLSGRLLAWAGGIALVLGSLFFLSLAFSRGWIGPELRVLIGFVAAAAALAAGAWLMERPRYRTPSVVLTAVGIAVGMLALYAAIRLYNFIPPPAGLLGAFIIASGAAAIAIRGDSQTVAMLGLVAALAAPPLFGARADLVSVLFIAGILVATTVIALLRSWSGMSTLAFLLAAPQVWSWLSGETPLPLALAGIAMFWLVNAIAAGGEALTGRRHTITVLPPTLLAMNGLFAIVALEQVLRDQSPVVQTVALVVLAAAHAALALPFLLRSDPRHPFVTLAAGAAAATLVITVGIELGGPLQPMAWTAIGVAVAWAGFRFDDRIVAAASGVPLGLALWHFIRFDYPSTELFSQVPSGVPFVSPEGAVLAVGLLGVAAVTASAAAAARRRSPVLPRWSPHLVVSIGAVVMAGLVAWAAPFELFAAWAVVVWAALAAALFVLAPEVRPDRTAQDVAVGAAMSLLALGVGAVLAVEIPLNRLVVDSFRSPATPLLNPGTVALAAIAGALVVGAEITPRPALRGPLTAWAGGVATYIVSVAVVDAFGTRVATGNSAEVELQAQVALSITWVVIGVLAFAVGLLRSDANMRAFGLGLLALATAKVFLFDLAALDVAYRVLSFVGLGLALLGSSFLAARLRRQSSG